MNQSAPKTTILNMFFSCASPKPKERPRFCISNNRAVIYTPQKTKSFEAQLKHALSIELQLQNPNYSNKFPCGCPVGVELIFKMPRKNKIQQLEEYCCKRPDLDNLAKSVLDAMNKIIFKDDAQVASLKAKKLYSKTTGINILVYQLLEE